MAINYNPRIITNGLRVYVDTNNPKCVDASQTIDTNTRLNNLVGDGLQFSPYDTTNGNMSFVQESNGQWVYDQNGLNGGEPCWNGISIDRVDTYTFICWFKYQIGGSYQRAENIYGGGFDTRTSFYLSPGGTSTTTALLRYSDLGSTDSYSLGGDYGTYDGEWHMYASTDTGGDGNQTTKMYIDGVLKNTTSSNGTHDTPDGTGGMVWCGWSTTYGNLNGRSNCFMYYESLLSDDDIAHTYNVMKSRFA